LHRAFNYGSFALSAAAIGALLVKKPDVMYVYQPITIGLAAVVIKYLRQVPFVIDIQDLWPEFLPATGMINNQKTLWSIGKWCEFIYRQARCVTTLSPGFKDSIVGRGIAADKVEVVYNWCDEKQVDLTDFVDPKLKEKLGFAGRFNVVFAGTMGKAQALCSVLDAAKKLQEKAPRVQFVFVGAGVEEAKLKTQAREMGLDNVLFLARRPLTEIGQLLKCADVQLVHLKDDPFFAITVPSKTQTSLAVGRPVLMGVRGDAADLVIRAKAGLTCTPEDPASIANAILSMEQMPQVELDQMGLNGRKFYFDELSLKVGAERFEKIFMAIAARRV
jgi:glycosyltransferase involved in cell wall biosynthesis